MANPRHWLAKLTPAKVRLVRKLAKSGLSQAKIGERVGISQSSVFNLLKRKTYKKVA